MAVFLPSLDRRSNREALVKRWFSGTARTYDRVVRVTTLGYDEYWKRRLLGALPRMCRSILDLACGTGIVLVKLARRFPGARLVGVDITDEYLDVAREKARRGGFAFEFILSNAETMELEGQFDAVVSSYIPKYVDPEKLLERITPHLRPGGVLALHDFTYPRGWLARAFWRLHMAVVNRLGRRIFPSWEHCLDRELPALIRRTKWPRRFREALEKFGYRDIRVHPLTYRMSTLLTARR